MWITKPILLVTKKVVFYPGDCKTFSFEDKMFRVLGSLGGVI